MTREQAIEEVKRRWGAVAAIGEWGKLCAVGVVNDKGSFSPLGMGITWQRAFENADSGKGEQRGNEQAIQAPQAPPTAGRDA